MSTDMPDTPVGAALCGRPSDPDAPTSPEGTPITVETVHKYAVRVGGAVFYVVRISSVEHGMFCALDDDERPERFVHGAKDLRDLIDELNRHAAFSGATVVPHPTTGDVPPPIHDLLATGHA